MTDHSRRDVLKVSGTLLGGIALGTGTVTATTSDERFVVKTQGKKVEKSDLTVVHDLSQIGYYVVEGREADVKRLGKYAPDVTYELDLPAAETDTETSAKDEPFYFIQWDKQATNVPEAQAVTRGEGTRVAVIDTGIAADHPELEHAVNTELGRNFTTDDLGANAPYGGEHGTHCSGIIAANDQNQVGVTGTAPGAELVDCRVFTETGEDSGSFASVVAAILYAAEIGCDVANLSLGAYPVPRQGQGNFLGNVLNKATNYARNNGTLLAVAAGNDAADLQHDGSVISVPNESAGSVSVAATGPIGFNWGADGLEAPYDTPANYTNYGTNAVDIAAPGGNYDPTFPAGWYYDLVFNTVAIPSYDEDGNYLGAKKTYAWLAGTSMAAPAVAGAAALVKAENPDYNPHQVRAQLKQTADDSALPADKSYYGAGFLDVEAAVTE